MPPPPKKEARLGAVALFEYLCSCWRKCATVGPGYELFFPQALLGVIVYLLLPSGQEVAITMPTWHCHAPSNDNNGLNL